MSEKLIVEIKAVIKLTLIKMRIPHFNNTDIYFSVVLRLTWIVKQVFIVRVKVKQFMMTEESVARFDHEQVCMASFITL